MPFAIVIYLLELFVAFVQAYIFTMLSALFIGMGVAMGHHDEHAHEEHAEAHEAAHGKPELAVNPANAPGNGFDRTPRPDAAAGGRPKGHPRPPHKRVQTSKGRTRKS